MASRSSGKITSYAFSSQTGALGYQSQNGVTVLRFKNGVQASAIAEAVRLVGTPHDVATLSEREFSTLLEEIYKDDAVEATQAADADDDLNALAETAAASDDLLEQADDAPVVRLLNAILLEAIRSRASDVHIDTLEKRLSIRFRIDGVLREIVQPRRGLSSMLISRVKVMAKLDIAERRLPQDGRVSLRVGGKEVDVRVSTIPSQYGERAVLRLLVRSSTQLGLGSLGMSSEDSARFSKLLLRPNGLLLVTGPTGSGKTTTLYAALDRLNDQQRNIMTVEDPIEYTLDGIAQMQVNSKADLTFARGLRAILRQDPDIIMVGEIRDRETAQVAVESAMTGHFVLSTLHTNTAIGAITRLVDMGVERFLLAPMLRGVVAQRLVRKLCEKCKKPRPAEAQDLIRLDGLSLNETLFEHAGCEDCQNTGYSGRSAIYEIVEVNHNLERMIQVGASEAELTAAARLHSASLLADGLRLIRKGLTTVEEVSRVVREDSDAELHV